LTELDEIPGTTITKVKVVKVVKVRGKQWSLDLSAEGKGDALERLSI